MARSTPTRSTGSRSSANGTYSQVRRHRTPSRSGARLPQDWRGHATIPGNGAGFFQFDKELTSSNGLEQQRDSTATRSPRSCSAIPSATSERAEHVHADHAAQRLHVLLRRLRAGRLARELEVHAELRPSPRARDRPGASRTTTSPSASISTATSALSSVVIPASRSERRHAGAYGHAAD